jgi:hypothetical protein
VKKAKSQWSEDTPLSLENDAFLARFDKCFDLSGGKGNAGIRGAVVNFDFAVWFYNCAI